MKSILSFTLYVLIATVALAQSKTDQLILSNEVREVVVEEVDNNFIKYKFPNENASYTISKHLVEKIIFSSGREETFESSFKPVKSVADYSNVYISYIPQDVEGLKSLGPVFSKAVGVTTLSSINNVNNRAVRKVKIEAAMMGANVVFVGNVFQRGNQYGNENIPGNATMTSISGTAYLSKPNFDLGEAKQRLQSLEFVLFQRDKLNRNAFDKSSEIAMMHDEKMRPKTFMFREVNETEGELFVKTDKIKSKTGRLKVIFMDENMLTLMERHGNAIYNYILLSENEPRMKTLKKLASNTTN